MDDQLRGHIPKANENEEGISSNKCKILKKGMDMGKREGVKEGSCLGRWVGVYKRGESGDRLGEVVSCNMEGLESAIHPLVKGTIFCLTIPRA